MVDMTAKNGSTHLGMFLDFSVDAKGYGESPASDPRLLHARLHLNCLGDAYCVPALRPLRGTEFV